jgi:hypothetical protein
MVGSDLHAKTTRNASHHHDGGVFCNEPNGRVQNK